MLGVFKRRLKPKRAREEKQTHSSHGKAGHKSEAIVPVDVARIAPSQRQIHPLFEDKAQLLTYHDSLPPNPTTTTTTTKRPTPTPPFASARLHPVHRLPPQPLTPPPLRPAPNICVHAGRIEFIKPPSGGASAASRSPSTRPDNAAKANSLSQCGLNPQPSCVGRDARAQETEVDFPESPVGEEKCDFAKEFLEPTIKELQRLLECERETVQKERLAVARLQKQLARREATQRDVDRERRLRADIESRLRETVSESERYRETLAGLQREFSKMEDTVRTMLQYKTRCELLNQERVFLTAIYESRVVQFQNTITKLEQENESLKQRLHLLQKIGTEEDSAGLLQRLRSLESENAHLFQDADFQRKQYESCLDDIANQVVRALLSQKGLREEIGNLQRRIKELENQNHALANVLTEKLCKNSAFALPYPATDPGANPENNSSVMFPGLFPSEARPREQSATGPTSSFSCRSGERRRLQRLLLNDVGEKSILKSLSSIESLIVVPLQRPRSLSLHLHTSPVPLSAAAAVMGKQCQNRKGKLTLVTLSKKPSEDEGNESPESGNRDEGYSTMSSDMQGLGETNELSKRELEDLKEASDETDVIADSTGEMTSTAVIEEDMSDPDMFFIPVNLSLAVNSRQSYPPSRKFLPFQHAMRSFSDSHLFLKLTATGAVSPSISPSVLLVDVLDRTRVPRRNKPLTGAPARGKREPELHDSRSSTESWCSGSWWDTEFFQHWLKLDDTRLKQQQQRDMLQLQYDRTEIEEWSMSLSCEDVTMSAEGEFSSPINETPESLSSLKKSTSNPEASARDYRNPTTEDEERWFGFDEESDPKKPAWPLMSPDRSWGSASTSAEDCRTLNDCLVDETRSMGSPAVSEDPEESSAIDTDFTRDFYRLVKFESTKSLASNSSKSNGHCDLGLLNKKQAEFAQEREMALQSVLSFIVEQQKYCHHREEEDNEASSAEGRRRDADHCEEDAEDSYVRGGGRAKGKGAVVGCSGRAVDANESPLAQSAGNESISVNNQNSDVRTCESEFLKGPINKKTNGSLKKRNHNSARREVTTKLPVRNYKRRNLVQNCAKDEKSQTTETFSRSLEPVKARRFVDFLDQNKKQEKTASDQNSKQMSASSSAHTLHTARPKKTLPNNISTGSSAVPNDLSLNTSASTPDANAPRFRSYPRIKGTKIPVFSSKKLESSAAIKPLHPEVESPRFSTLKDREGDTNIPVLASRSAKSCSSSSPKNLKTPEDRSSRLLLVDDDGFHDEASSKDVINELNKMIRQGEDLTPSNADGEHMKPLDLACCCPTGWVHVERDIDFTDPKARANLLDVMLASSGSSSGSGSSTESGGDEPVDYTHLHRLHRFRRQRKASATREQLGVLRYPLTSARPSIIGRDNFFVRYGDKEKEAVASFDFLDDLSTASASGCSSCDSLDSDPNVNPRPATSPIRLQQLPSPEADVCTPLTPTTPMTPSDDGDKKTADLVSFSDSCADSYAESVGSLDE